MYCDRCGAQMQPGQKFCGSCGKAVSTAPAPSPGDGRVARHITLLAILWLVASALNLIGAAALFFVGNTVFGHMIRIGAGWPFEGFLQGLFSSLSVLVLAKALAGFAAGWGLLERQPWARPLALVLGFISLIHVPLGTALGIYTIWVLLSRQADVEYQQLSRAT